MEGSNYVASSAGALGEKSGLAVQPIEISHNSIGTVEYEMQVEDHFIIKGYEMK